MDPTDIVKDAGGQEINKGDHVQMINDAANLTYVIKEFAKSDGNAFIRIRPWARAYDKGFWLSPDEIRKC